MKKRTFFPILAFALASLFAGCEKDNFDAPASTLTGRVVYQGQPLGVRSNGVQLELWQRGYQLFTKIPIYVAQDGTFSASLFDGDYKLTRLKGNGPWIDNTDTIDVQVRGGATVEVPVVPYFTISDFAVQRSNTTLNSTFKLQQINNAQPLEFVRLFVGQTLITDATNNAAFATKNAADITDLSQPVSLSTGVPAGLAGKDFVYVRLGVKMLNVAELLYSQPIKVNLK